MPSPTIQFNSVTKEPYIRLPPPHANITLTPARYTDGPSMMTIHNHPSVYQKLIGPPFPYTEEAWEAWWLIISDMHGRALKEYLDVLVKRKSVAEEGDKEGKVDKGKEWWVGTGQPVSIFREDGEDGAQGTGKILGEISIRRRGFGLVKDEKERERLKEINDELEAGNEETQWEMGFLLSPTAQGRGIMPLALKTLIDCFYVPYMNVHKLTGSYHDTNLASKRVFEKSGFVFETLAPDVVELSEKKFGAKGLKCGLGVMRWERKE